MSQTGAAGPLLPKAIPEDTGLAGPLALVDISGYTTYVAETELTHSQVLISELLDAVLQSLVSRRRSFSRDCSPSKPPVSSASRNKSPTWACYRWAIVTSR